MAVLLTGLQLDSTGQTCKDIPEGKPKNEDQRSAEESGRGSHRLHGRVPGASGLQPHRQPLGLLLLVTLGEGPLRFHLLRDRIEGISEKMLSQTLKALVRDGLVRRLVEPTIPPRVTYELTPIGGELAAPLREVIERLGRFGRRRVSVQADNRTAQH